MKNKQQAIEIMTRIRNLDRNHADFDAAQRLLAELGILALPKPGHSCPECNRGGALYCFDTAVRNIRSMPETEG